VDVTSLTTATAAAAAAAAVADAVSRAVQPAGRLTSTWRRHGEGR